jgi:hypothetical protein
MVLGSLTHHNIDIACITETHLSNSDKIEISGYIIHPADRVHNHEPWML